MESDPVAHMIGVIAVEPPGTPLWFDIIGKRSSWLSSSLSGLYRGEPVYAFLIFVHVSEMENRKEDQFVLNCSILIAKFVTVSNVYSTCLK